MANAGASLDAGAKRGMDVRIGAATYTGRWKAFTTVGDTVIAAYTDDLTDAIAGSVATVIDTTETIAGGTLIVAAGMFTSIQLTSGGIACVREV